MKIEERDSERPVVPARRDERVRIGEEFPIREKYREGGDERPSGDFQSGSERERYGVEPGHASENVGRKQDGRDENRQLPTLPGIGGKTLSKKDSARDEREDAGVSEKEFVHSGLFGVPRGLEGLGIFGHHPVARFRGQSDFGKFL